MSDVRIEAAAKALARTFDCDFDNASRSERRGFKGDAKTALKAADAVDPLRSPRVAGTVEDRDALPNGAAIRDVDGGVYEAVKRVDGKNWWLKAGMTGVYPSDLFDEVTVIDLPEVP